MNTNSLPLLRCLPRVSGKHNCGVGGFECPCCSEPPRTLKPRVRRWARRKMKQLDNMGIEF